MENPENDTLSLVRKAKRGNAHAYGELMMLHKEYLYRTAFLYMKNQDMALEVLQEATIQGMLSIKKLKEPQYFKTWISRILYNCAMDQFRKSSKSIPFEPENMPQQDPIQAQGGITQEEKMDLHRAVDSLNEPYRSLIILKYFDGLTITEISQTTSKPEGTVKSDLSRARKQLRNLLKEGYIYA